MSARTDEELESLWDNAGGGVAGSNRALYELGIADAKAEVERLREQLRQHDSGVACFIRWTGLQREADELRRLAWEWCIDCKTCADYGYHALGDVLRLRAEVDELRALAWEWCIEARSGREALEPHERHYSELYREKLRIEEERDELRAQLQRLTDDAYEVDHRGNCPEPPIDPTALRIVPHGATVVVQEQGRYVRDEPPIESLGPVPLSVNAVETWEHGNGSVLSLESRLVRIERALAYVIRDAVRRGAKLEGDDR